MRTTGSNSMGAISRTLPALLVLLFSFSFSSAQRLAVVTPDKSTLTEKYTSVLTEKLSDKFKVLDPSVSESGFQSMRPESPFNLSSAESKQLASVLGTDFLLILKTGIQRRMSFSRSDYFEAYAVSFLISGRTGRLVDWKLDSFESETAGKAESLLVRSVDSTAANIQRKAESVKREELTLNPKSVMEEVPSEGSREARNFRPPVPYKRIKPEYSRIAHLYDIRATVDIEVDIDADGKILRTEVVRWGGYGLDESVDQAVRSMNWRPAERNGRPLPMRVLLRYNFTKVEDTESY